MFLKNTTSLYSFLGLIVFLLLTAACKITGSSKKINYPFPQSATYSNGIKPNGVSQEEMNMDCQKAYDNWIKDWVIAKGCPKNSFRVDIGSGVPGFLTPHDTVSEGIAWGMLITVFMDNTKNNSKKYFDGFNVYRKNYLNANSLMKWRIDDKGEPVYNNAATEADQNIAMALLFAHYQWGSDGATNYLKEAKELIKALLENTIEESTYVVKPGDDWGGSDVLNPCYFTPAYYKIWSEYNSDWNLIIKKSYSILKYFHEKNATGLFPDWTTAEGKKYPNLDYFFSYNACQIPLKAAMDFCWFGTTNDPLAKKINEKIIKWLEKDTSSNPKNIVDGYELDGKRKGAYNNACFVGPFTAGAMTCTENQPYCNKLYDLLRSYPTGGDYSYYPDTLRLVSLLFATGNMPNITQVK